MPTHVPLPDHAAPQGTNAQIDENDPLGLGELRVDEQIPHQVRLPPAPRTVPEPDTGSGVDLAAIADMARRVEDARFAAERRLHDSLQPSPPSIRPADEIREVRRSAAGAVGRPAIDPVVRRMAAQAVTGANPSAAPPTATEPAVAGDHRPPTPGASEPGRPVATPGPHAATAATAALRDLLSDTPAEEPAKSPGQAGTTVPVPSTEEASTRPARLRTEADDAPESSRPGFTDTASLLRELASLSDLDDAGPGTPATPVPARPATRPVAVTPARARRKGLFAR